MLIQNILSKMSAWAPPAFQESYDNCGLITGNPNWDFTGALCTLDATEAIVQEAIEKNATCLWHITPLFSRGSKVFPAIVM